jgi:hypothetical protein
MGKKSEIFKVFDGLQATANKIIAPITEQHGKFLREWVEGLSAPDMELEKAKTALKTASLEGTEIFQAAWVKLSPEHKRKLKDFKDNLKAAAAEFDKQKEDADNATKKDDVTV